MVFLPVIKMIKPVNRTGNMEKREKDIDQITGVVSLTFINSMIRRSVSGPKVGDDITPPPEFIDGYI
jgi:hypothetical protein